MKLIFSRENVFIYFILCFLTIFFLIPIPTVKAQSYFNINVVTAYNMINNSTQYPDLVILDVREQWEYNINHLCDSLLIPVSDIDARINELEAYKDTEIIVYCKGGSRSAQASQNLVDNHNFTKIYNMLGGIDAWIAAGYEVCEGQSNPIIYFWHEAFLIVFIATTIIITFLFIKKQKVE